MTISFIFGVVTVILGVLYSYQAFIMPKAPMGDPNAPMIFPAILGISMTILGAVLLVQEKARQKREGESKRVSFAFTIYGKSIAIVAFMCLVYVFLFERIGYVFSTFLFLVSVLQFFNGLPKWKTTLAVSAGFSIGIYVVFSILMGISLPTTPFIGY